MHFNPEVIIKNIGILAVILQSICIAGGIGLLVIGFLRLKRYGEMRTFMSHQMTLFAPLMIIVSGILLLSAPITLRAVLVNFWSTSNPLHYSTDQAYSGLTNAVVVFVRFIGACSVVRGIFLLSRTGNAEQSQPGNVGKALMHLFGGILCIHILRTVELFKRFLGFY